MIKQTIKRIADFLGNLRVKGEHYWLWPFSGPPKTATVVTPESAMAIAAYWCGSRIIAESIARMPFHLVRKEDGKGSDKLTDDSRYWMIKKRVNPRMTSFQWKETMGLHLCTHGNHYSLKIRNGLGEVIALSPLLPDDVRMDTEGGKLFYYVIENGKEVTYPPEKILHIRGLSQDGLVGLSPVATARRSLAIVSEAEEYGENFFANNASPGWILTHPGKLGKKGRKELRDAWDEQHKGSINAGKTAVFEEGVEFNRVGLPPADAHFLQTRVFGIREIARILNLPPVLLHDLEHSTDRGNVEQLTTNLLVISIDPWLLRIEEQLDMDLLDEKEMMAGITFKANTGQFMRADYKGRMEGGWKGRQAGLWSIDDLRELEDKPPLENNAGKTFLIPANHYVLDPSRPEGEQIINPGLDPSQDNNEKPGEILTLVDDEEEAADEAA